MTTIQQQVVGTQMALKLKKSGVPQDAVFFWALVLPNATWKLVSKSSLAMISHADAAAAFSVAELGDFFPDDFNISYKRVARDSYMRSSVDCYDANENKTWKLYPKRTNEADARAHMLDLLVVGGFITL